MRRLATIVTRPSLRKPVSVAAPRVFALAAWTAGSTHGGVPVVPVTQRVRDGLVLRVVAKKKSPAKHLPDEHRAR